mmetsp:Transcript_1950/g.3620  ORF Transcript_1950/g.3620 Transcript_1950/m.3620 type:complete len:221 (-) Transcript_1950:903-1565(-)
MIFMSTTTFHDIKECQIKCCAMSVYTHTTLPATAIATLSTALYRTEPEQLRTNITRNAVFTRVTNLHSSIEPVFLLNPCITCEVQNSQQHSPMPWNVAEIDFGFDYLNRIRLLICRNRHQYALLQYLYQPLEIGSTTSFIVEQVFRSGITNAMLEKSLRFKSGRPTQLNILFTTAWSRPVISPTRHSSSAEGNPTCAPAMAACRLGSGIGVPFGAGCVGV